MSGGSYGLSDDMPAEERTAYYILRGMGLKLTCIAAPVQWGGELVEGVYLYFRARHGHYELGLGKDEDEAALHAWKAPLAEGACDDLNLTHVETLEIIRTALRGCPHFIAGNARVGIGTGQYRCTLQVGHDDAHFHPTVGNW